MPQGRRGKPTRPLVPQQVSPPTFIFRVTAHYRFCHTALTDHSDFQGKRINPSFVNPAAGHPFKPSGGVSAGPRPVLNTQILLAHGPTNAHGGVNFNRVKPARLAQQVQAQAAVQALGMGWPTSLYKSKAYLNHRGFLATLTFAETRQSYGRRWSWSERVE